MLEGSITYYFSAVTGRHSYNMDMMNGCSKDTPTHKDLKTESRQTCYQRMQFLSYQVSLFLMKGI